MKTPNELSADTLSIETEIRIAAPPALVWPILTAFANYGDWNRYITSITGVAEAGANIVVRTRDTMSGHEMAQTVRIERLEPHLMHWVGMTVSPKQLRSDHFFELLPVAGDETVLLHREAFSGNLAAVVLAQYGEPMRTNFETFNECLKASAEAARGSSVRSVRS
ncbi:SRPBCC domain-containing protein [Bradyrhizobium sp. INPA03-11B]|uniref:SRPBCC domain-containing protein n=1 Tax=Bradyrhizobium sp. INPA03-11B TaxID=418598 RepID=UPI00338EEC4D